MTPLEAACYTDAYEYFIRHEYVASALGVVYLTSSPAACAERIRTRARSEERSVSLEYLERLHAQHERAFARPDAWRGAPRLTLDAETLGNVPSDDVAATIAAMRIETFIREKVLHQGPWCGINNVDD